MPVPTSLVINLDATKLTVGDQKALFKYDPFRFSDFMLRHSTLTEPEIDALEPEDLKAVFERITAALQESAVPKATSAP